MATQTTANAGVGVQTTMMKHHVAGLPAGRTQTTKHRAGLHAVTNQTTAPLCGVAATTPRTTTGTTRIVSHAFRMGEWEPEAERDVNGRMIYFWRVPKKGEKPKGL